MIIVSGAFFFKINLQYEYSLYKIMIDMEKNLFKYIYQNSKSEQFALSCIIWLSYPVYLLSLEFPKIIVNRAFGASLGPVHEFSLFNIIDFSIRKVRKLIFYLYYVCFFL